MSPSSEGAVVSSQFGSAKCAKPAGVPLLDVNRETASIREELLAAITSVVDSGKFLHGPDVARLE